MDFRKGDKVEDLNGSTGKIIGKDEEIEDNYVYYIVQWDKKHTTTNGKQVKLTSSIRGMELTKIKV
jgi:hypothetical protein